MPAPARSTSIAHNDQYLARSRDCRVLTSRLFPIRQSYFSGRKRMGRVPSNSSRGSSPRRTDSAYEFGTIQCNDVCCICCTLAHGKACELNTYVLQFATTEIARAAGYPDIRAMREAFHARAKARLPDSKSDCASCRALSVPRSVLTTNSARSGPL